MGAAGFTGAQLISILQKHESFKLNVITSDSNCSKKLIDVYPEFINSEAGIRDLEFLGNDDDSLLTCDLVFLAVPHKVAMKKARKLLENGIVVIDLSADFRFNKKEVYERYYGVKHTEPELLKERFFGLPELFREDIVKAFQARQNKKDVLVGCAGCYVTASSLACKPFVDSEFFDEGSLPVIDAMSGLSGAGKNPGERGLYVFANDNFEAYGVGNHRHTPEIEQILGERKVIFTPHLAPANRGILATATMMVDKNKSVSAEEIREIYKKAYDNCTFVKVLDEGKFPKTKSVIGTNFAHIGISFDKSKGVVQVISAIDNLVKGASGQAVQCANIVFGLKENEGLTNIALTS